MAYPNGIDERWTNAGCGAEATLKRIMCYQDAVRHYAEAVQSYGRIKAWNPDYQGFMDAMHDCLLDEGIPKELLVHLEQVLVRLCDEQFWGNNDVGKEPVSQEQVQLFLAQYAEADKSETKEDVPAWSRLPPARPFDISMIKHVQREEDDNSDILDGSIPSDDDMVSDEQLEDDMLEDDMLEDDLLEDDLLEEDILEHIRLLEQERIHLEYHRKREREFAFQKHRDHIAKWTALAQWNNDEIAQGREHPVGDITGEWALYSDVHLQIQLDKCEDMKELNLTRGKLLIRDIVGGLGYELVFKMPYPSETPGLDFNIPKISVPSTVASGTHFYCDEPDTPKQYLQFLGNGYLGLSIPAYVVGGEGNELINFFAVSRTKDRHTREMEWAKEDDRWEYQGSYKEGDSDPEEFFCSAEHMGEKCPIEDCPKHDLELRAQLEERNRMACIDPGPRRVYQSPGWIALFGTRTGVIRPHETPGHLCRISLAQQTH
ncbi:hypothetical protein J4E85_009113 [Alternaria conjuncta]|uniref:uncharacterized protein n=1 Tax=Alternaria conjuncta TaxID=181017 RepID=UPI002220FC85|nr:uncharacterized protein J4E85_009113 [Alternaria conjuncta]KAI4920998.1 hypothetical protein J4E85_009113 [Alternaria conjuncta]